MRIAIVSPKMFPIFTDSSTDSYGGAEIALSLVARQLSQFDDKDIHVLVGDYGQSDQIVFDRITAHRCLDKNGGALKNGLRFVYSLKKVNANVYIQRTLTVASALIAFFCKIMRRRFIYWVAHDNETDGGHTLYNKQFSRYLVRYMFENAALVVLQNNYEKECLTSRFPNVNCTVIKKGIELGKIDDSLEAIYDAVWVGRCDEWKNPLDFIELAKAHPQQSFLMICPAAVGKEALHKEVVKSAVSAGNLELRGRTKNSEVLELVSKSKLYCITSSQEGDWPVVVLEAASLRRPVLSLHLSYDGLIDDYRGGVNCSGDFHILSSEFARLIEDHDARTSMGHGAYRYVAQTHDVETQTTKLIEMIDELC